MCFDEKTSWTTFAIGTIFNVIGILYYKDKTFTAMALCWQWVLLMQIFDAIAWRNRECGSTLNKFATGGAYVSNLMQPIVVFLAFISITDVSQKYKIAAIILICVYISWILTTSRNLENKKCLTTKKGCDHLNYYWWSIKNGSNQVYIITLVSIFLLLVRPFKFAVFTALYILISLVLSLFIYKCGNASIWCWFAAFAPIFNLFLFKVLK